MAAGCVGGAEIVREHTRWRRHCIRIDVVPPGIQPVLVITRDPATGEALVRRLRALKQVAIWIDTCGAALEMMQVLEFALVIVDVDRRADWATCRRIVARRSCPVAVVTRFLNRDRRYRTCAFELGVAAYVCKPCTQSRLRELLRRAASGNRDIEVIGGAAYCDL